MGNKQQGILKRGYGYRVISIKPKSPLQNLVQPFFDFIIETITESTPKQILSKLTNQNPEQKPFIARIKQQLGKNVTLKIYSTKYQNVRQVQFIPNSDWSGTEDLIGIGFRLENYQDARFNYTKISNIQKNSPIQQANLKQGDYLIGVVQFKYQNIQQLVDNLYQIYYNKQIPNKFVRFVTYNIKNNKLQITNVQLKRKWGGDGLLGCQFLQGHLYKFPKNLQQIRNKISSEDKQRQEANIARMQLSKSDGTSKALAQSLKRRANQATKKKQIPIKNMTLFNVLKQKKEQIIKLQLQQKKEEIKYQKNEKNLQQRVRNLEQTVQKLYRILKQVINYEEEL